jgi:hypothetical protein
MLFNVGGGVVVKVGTGMQVSKIGDADTVGGVELRLQEFTAGVVNVTDLQELGRWQQSLRKQYTTKCKP